MMIPQSQRGNRHPATFFTLCVLCDVATFSMSSDIQEVPIKSELSVSELIQQSVLLAACTR